MEAKNGAGAKDRASADDYAAAEVRDAHAMSEPGAVATGLFYSVVLNSCHILLNFLLSHSRTAC